MTVISYPTPLYQNVPINAQWYEPSKFTISAVSRGLQTTITTSVNHNFLIGQEVRTHIPPTFGIRELNGVLSYVIAIPNPNQVTVKIDSRNYNAYIASTATTPAQICAVGDLNSGVNNNSDPNNLGLSIPGSFTNISPL